MDDIRLDPGSAEARQRGCICDPDQTGPRFRTEKNCPVHGLAELRAYMEEEDDDRQRQD